MGHRLFARSAADMSTRHAREGNTNAASMAFAAFLFFFSSRIQDDREALARANGRPDGFGTEGQICGAWVAVFRALI